MRLVLCLFLALSFSCNGGSAGSSGKPKLTDRSKSGIITYMSEVISSNCIISGQQCGDGDDIETVYTNEVEAMYTLTGKKPAIIGTDFGWKSNQNFPVITDRLIQHWNSGGLVTVSWHVDNPFTAGYDPRINSVSGKSTLILSDLLSSAPANSAQSNFTTELNKVIVQLKVLKDAGVIVIWRPFHEMNGDWFWWGIDSYGTNQTNVGDFTNLWKDVYDILVNDNNLDNLIWVFSPSKYESLYTSLPDKYYPGSGFVDMVGIDSYTPAPEFSDFATMSALNKPVAMCEIGPSSISYGSYDERMIPAVLAGKAAYFLQWHSWPGAEVSIVDNLHYQDLLNSDKVITLSDM